jgi:hypothetical protein
MAAPPPVIDLMPALKRSLTQEAHATIPATTEEAKDWGIKLRNFIVDAFLITPEIGVGRKPGV